MTQLSWHENVELTRRSFSRRSFLYGAAATAGATTFDRYRFVQPTR